MCEAGRFKTDTAHAGTTDMATRHNISCFGQSNLKHDRIPSIVVVIAMLSCLNPRIMKVV